MSKPIVYFKMPFFILSVASRVYMRFDFSEPPVMQFKSEQEVLLLTIELAEFF